MITEGFVEGIVKQIAKAVMTEVKAAKKQTGQHPNKDRAAKAKPERTQPCTTKPDCDDLVESREYEEKLVRITEADTGSGEVKVTKVFFRLTDKTYWKAVYWVKLGPGNNNFHGLFDGEADITQVWPGERKMMTFLTYDEKQFGSEKGVPWRTTI